MHDSPESAPGPAIEAEELSKTYPGSGTPALDRISFTVQRGEIFGILGPNGAGKTTAVSILSTLIRPTSGSARVLGMDVSRRPSEVRRLIGIVPQEIAIYPGLTARQNLVFFGSLYGIPRGMLALRADDALKLVGLENRADARVSTFSGGMQRRLNLAAGIIHSPAVLLLDEPTVGVDPQSRRFIFENVNALARNGMAVVYTTHYMEEAEELCTRIAVVDEGRIVATGRPRDLVREHGEDRIRIAVESSLPGDLVHGLDAFAETGCVKAGAGVIEMRVRSAHDSLAGVLEFLRGKGVKVLSLDLKPASLENVFIKLTGKGLRD